VRAIARDVHDTSNRWIELYLSIFLLPAGVRLAAGLLSTCYQLSPISRILLAILSDPGRQSHAFSRPV
jgi:hypothetical protein